jgi:hypothetical protein
MGKIYHAKNGQIMKHIFYIHLHKCNNKLIGEKDVNGNNYKNILFDIVIAYTDTNRS